MIMLTEAFNSGIKIVKMHRSNHSVYVQYSDEVKTTIGYSKYLLEQKYGRINPGYRVFRKDLNNKAIFENLFVAKTKGYTTLKCGFCKKSFTRLSSLIRRYRTQKHKVFYCSVACAVRHTTTYQGVTQCICKFCGKKFIRHSSMIKWFLKHRKLQNHFCSKICFINHQKSKSKMQAFKCTYCKKKFERPLSKSKRIAKNSFCSIKCYIDYLVKEATIVVSCTYCGKDIIRKRSSIRKFKGQKQQHFFCNRQCWILGHGVITITKRALSKTALLT